MDEMNKRAKTYSMKLTNYANPHGLPNKANKSTAEDIAKIAMIAMKNDLFREVVCKK